MPFAEPLTLESEFDLQRYEICYVDPPWKFSETKTGSRFGGGAMSHYEGFTIKQMVKWAPQFLAMRPPSGIMLMWTTDDYFTRGDAATLMRAWGYEPITVMWYWMKILTSGAPYPGPGHYAASSVEPMIIGQASKSANYKVKRRLASNRQQRLMHPTDVNGKIIHSAKPLEFYDLISRTWGTEASRVEVFARQQQPGWDAIGAHLPTPSVITPDALVHPSYWVPRVV